MIKRISKIFLKSAVVITMMFSVFSFAYALEDYTVLAPLPGTTQVNNCTGTDCKTDLGTYLPGLFNLTVGLAAVFAFVMITWGGVEYMTTEALNGKSNAKGRIQNALAGLALVISAYVILNTINPNLVNFNLNFPVPKTVPADTVGAITSGNNAANLLPSTTNALLDLTNQCTNCKIVVTSTTGDSHDVNSTHYQGKAVDVAPDPKLNAFISNNASSIADCQTFTKTFGGKTTTFLWENKGSKCGGTVASNGDHWHITVNP